MVVSEELLYEFMRYSQLSEDEEEQCVKIFMQADLDGNGELDSYELLQVFRALGQEPTEEELLSVFARVDEDRNGTINPKEFIKFMEYLRRSTSENREHHPIANIEVICRHIQNPRRYLLSSVTEFTVPKADEAQVQRVLDCRGSLPDVTKREASLEDRRSLQAVPAAHPLRHGKRRLSLPVAPSGTQSPLGAFARSRGAFSFNPTSSSMARQSQMRDNRKGTFHYDAIPCADTASASGKAPEILPPRDNGSTRYSWLPKLQSKAQHATEQCETSSTLGMDRRNSLPRHSSSALGGSVFQCEDTQTQRQRATKEEKRRRSWLPVLGGDTLLGSGAFREWRSVSSSNNVESC
mmetsp:Transcript_33154/g.63657  ORF Transcript_33154/g.63657 Transcript_33154/m.63657 type:complete len:351 (-) Transcript_33154:239-1291(-)|eukprot:CAMPEP_0114249806 /NCGR_PEP_ID=MMETSP0058-20121206/14351_1 /TAXON_ID=36894 /ORGANISM="Pyramimonas parkeae, CCMP726" /LENGTH=350 /DNA_ID=CAMNT_0001363401 /DNA_START=369 /DNA_END=1421 /DNA_ORIENTATION=+